MSITTAKTFPTSGSFIAGAGVDWDNPPRIPADDTLFANTSSEIPASGGQSDYILGKTFGFAIPANSRILGFTVETVVKVTVTANYVYIDSIALTKDGSTIAGGEKSGSGDKIGTTEETQTYGSSSDLWSATWTPADVNSANFGVMVRFCNSHASTAIFALIDYVAVQVTYELLWGGKILETITNPGEVLEEDSNVIHSIMGVVAGATGYSLGGYTSASINTIQDLDFPSETAATITATLDAATYGGAGVNSSRKGYNMGGYTTANTAVIDDLFFIAETSQAIAGTLNTAKRSGAGCSAPLKGFIFGGYTSVNVAVIEDITFSTEASVAIAATLDTAMRGNAGAYSNIKGYSLGGRNADGDYVTIIEDITYSSEASAALAATLDAARGWGTGVSSRYKGYVMSGIGAANTAVIEDLVFADETSQAIVATLDTAKYGGTGVQFVVKGYCMSGYTTENTNVIEDLVFPTETSAAISDTVTTANIYAAGVSFG